MNRLILLLSILFFLFTIIFCEAEEDEVPQPYEEEEFPQWLLDLRRAEIIFIGSIPITLAFSFETYDIYRYFSNDLQAPYKPWPFKDQNTIGYSPDEQRWLLISAFSASALITLLDFILRKIFPPQDIVKM